MISTVSDGMRLAFSGCPEATRHRQALAADVAAELGRAGGGPIYWQELLDRLGLAGPEARWLLVVTALEAVELELQLGPQGVCLALVAPGSIKP